MSETIGRNTASTITADSVSSWRAITLAAITLRTMLRLSHDRRRPARSLNGIERISSPPTMPLDLRRSRSARSAIAPASPSLLTTPINRLSSSTTGIPRNSCSSNNAWSSSSEESPNTDGTRSMMLIKGVERLATTRSPSAISPRSTPKEETT